MRPVLLFYLLLLACSNTSLRAQDRPESTYWFVETLDGNEYFGELVERTDAMVRIITLSLGEVTIPAEQIKQLYGIEADRIKNGQYWADNPQATRYFWAPNGFGLNQGEGYYQNVWVFFNQLSFGLSDNLSLGGGLVPAFLFEGASTPIWVTPKISLSIPGATDRLHLGAGALVGTVLGESDGGFGITYGVMTFGSRDSNANIGLGWGFVAGDWATTPALTLSGMYRISKRGYLMTENYIIDWGPNNLFLGSLGGRLVGKSMSFDFGLVIPVVYGQIDYAVPWLGVVILLGSPSKQSSSYSN